jgi:hypothetical protein
VLSFATFLLSVYINLYDRNINSIFFVFLQTPTTIDNSLYTVSNVFMYLYLKNNICCRKIFESLLEICLLPKLRIHIC